MRKKGVSSLEDLLKKMSNRPKLKKKLDGVEALDQLDEILGNNLKQYVTDKYFKNGVIYICLSSSVLRNELSMQKQGLISNVNQSIGKKLVKNIVLK
jgi:hypothetical protein